jgi:2-haloacid dehalogenase
MASEASHDGAQPGRRHAVTTDEDMGFAHVLSPQNVRAVVFDVGKVLVEWDPRYLYEKLIPDPVERAYFLDHVATRAWHFQHDAGRPFAETSAELIADHPGYRDLILAWGSRWLETMPCLIDGMADLVADLAQNDVPVFGITNFSGEFFPAFKAREAALFAPFRDIVVSGDEKLVKPDPAIFRLALRRFGLAAGEGLFVDDVLENVEASEAEGFVGHHFTDAAMLRRSLKKRGLL